MMYHPRMTKAEAQAALPAWLDPDTDRVATLCRQNAELTEEIVRLQLALWDANDRRDELADHLRHDARLRAELDRWRGYAGIATVAALTLGAILLVRFIGGT